MTKHRKNTQKNSYYEIQSTKGESASIKENKALAQRSVFIPYNLNMTSLYEISAEIMNVIREMEDSSTEEESEAAMKKFADLNMDFNVKIENTLKVIREMRSDYDKIESEIVRLKALADSKEKTAERLKKYVSDILQFQKIEKLDLDLFKLSFRPSQSLEIIDEALIPDEFKKPQDPKVDSALLKKAIIAGNTVLGATVVTKQNLQIK